MKSNEFLIAVFEFVILIFSLSVHECAHAWMASRLGDQTARLQGRVTLNPMYHVDPIGTLLIPGLAIFGPFIGLNYLGGLLIGWAKPTPVITRNFRKIVRDDNLVTLAGPASNLILVILAFLGMATILVLFHGSLPENDSLKNNVEALWTLFDLGIKVNLMLCLFNLLPIPPLDGSHIARNMMPYSWLNFYDGMGIFRWILLIFVGAPVVRFLMGPALHLVDIALNLIPVG